MAPSSLTYLRVAAATVLVAAYGCASPVSPPTEADLLILDARVVTATGEMLDRASIVVSDGHIEDVVVGGTVVAGDGYTVVPGLIDTHVHLLAKSPRVNSGAVRGPRVFILGPLLTGPGARPTTAVCADSPWCWAHIAVEVGDEQGAREAVDRIVEAGADGIAVAYDPGGNNPGVGPGVLRAIVDLATAHDLPVMMDPDRADVVSDALGAGVSRFVHTPHMRMADALVSRVAEAGVVVATTISGAGPFWGRPESASFEPRKNNVAGLVGSGAAVASGPPTLEIGQSGLRWLPRSTRCSKRR